MTKYFCREFFFITLIWKLSWKQSYFAWSLWWTWSSWTNVPRVMILAWQTKNVLGGQKSFKMINWKHYSLKIIAKHKIISNILVCTLKEIRSHTNWRQETLKDDHIFVKPGQPAEVTAKPKINDPKVMLYIWWYQRGVLYYELIKPGETVNGNATHHNTSNWSERLPIKRAEFVIRHEDIIFQHANARPHLARLVKSYSENSGWEVLPHPPYNSDRAPSVYHFWGLFQNAHTGIRFISEQDMKNWLHSFLQFLEDEVYECRVIWTIL